MTEDRNRGEDPVIDRLDSLFKDILKLRNLFSIWVLETRSEHKYDSENIEPCLLFDRVPSFQSPYSPNHGPELRRLQCEATDGETHRGEFTGRRLKDYFDRGRNTEIKIPLCETG